jgi:WD40 repeat protein
MRRRAALAVLALGALACGGGAAGGLVAERATRGPALTYAVWLGDRALVSVELAADFQLVVRTLDAAGAVRERRALRLGPAEWDVGALAVAGGRAFVGSADGSVREIELGRTGRAPRELRRFELGDRVTALALAADGALLVSGTAGGVLCLRRLADGALLQCAVAHGGAIAGLAVRGVVLASAAWDGGAALWQLPSLALIRRLDAAGAATAVALSDDGALLAVARSSRPPVRSPAIEALEEAGGGAGHDPAARIELVELASGAARVLARRGPVLGLAFTRDGGGLIAGGWQRAVELFDVASGRRRGRIEFCHLVRAVARSPDGRRLAAAGWAPRIGCPATRLIAIVD